MGATAPHWAEFGGEVVRLVRINDLLRELTETGVTLSFPASGKLRVHADRNSMKSEILVALKEHRDDIIEMYEERAAIMEYDGGLSREEAERGAQGSFLAPPGMGADSAPRDSVEVEVARD